MSNLRTKAGRKSAVENAARYFIVSLRIWAEPNECADAVDDSYRAARHLAHFALVFSKSLAMAGGFEEQEIDDNAK